jgi:hypothetical protein
MAFNESGIMMLYRSSLDCDHEVSSLPRKHGLGQPVHLFLNQSKVEPLQWFWQNSAHLEHATHTLATHQCQTGQTGVHSRNILPNATPRPKPPPNPTPLHSPQHLLVRFCPTLRTKDIRIFAIHRCFEMKDVRVDAHYGAGRKVLATERSTSGWQ